MKTWLNVRIEDGAVSATAFVSSLVQLADGTDTTVVTSEPLELPAAVKEALAGALASATAVLERKNRFDRAEIVASDLPAARRRIRMSGSVTVNGKMQ